MALLHAVFQTNLLTALFAFIHIVFVKPGRAFLIGTSFFLLLHVHATTFSGLMDTKILLQGQVMVDRDHLVAQGAREHLLHALVVFGAVMRID